jgi:ADP-ribosyl-[dinitrogen reductase] hydrolase
MKKSNNRYIKLNRRIAGSIWGLAIGDALGAPLEFQENFEPIKSYIYGGIHNVQIGEWTDDTSMALCLAQSLIDKVGFDVNDQMSKYLAWYEDGYMCTRAKIFDIGLTVEKALLHYRITKNPYSGLVGDVYSGNGSLMRLAPIAIYYSNDIKKAIHFAILSSKTTHKSNIAVDACRYFVQLLIGALNGTTKENLLSSNFIQKNHYHNEIQNVINGSFKNRNKFHSTGYVVDTLNVVLHAFYFTHSFEEGLLSTVNLGGDADTNGAVYGQLAGAYYGVDSIPNNLKQKLMMAEIVKKIILQLI